MGVVELIVRKSEEEHAVLHVARRMPANKCQHLWSWRRFHVPARRSTGCGLNRAYSVLTVFLSPFSAASSACHASVAHFTRTGNSFTPAKISSLPRSPPSQDL